MKLVSLISTALLMVYSSFGFAQEGKSIDQLKSEILSISAQYTNEIELADEAREILQPLVDELVALTPVRTEAEKLDQVAGGWKNVWSFRTFGFGIDNNQVYQIVSKDGYYYNFSKINLGKVEFATFLRGAYEDVGEQLRIEFTNNNIRLGFYPLGTNLMELGESFEAGEIRSVAIPGPIGVTGDLINLYVDEDLRIVTGRSDGETVDDLFILRRVSEIVED